MKSKKHGNEYSKAEVKEQLTDIQETVDKVDQAPKGYDPEPEPAAREPRSFWENHVLLAVVGCVLAAVMYQVFRG